MRWKSLPAVLGAVCLLQAGFILGRLVPGAQDAHAESPADAPFYDPPRLLCRPFTVPMEGAGATLETNDRTTEIGRWIEQQEERYELFSLDFEIGQKATGYPSAVTWVCLSPRR